MKPRMNQKINLTIQSMGANGEGIGYWHGYTVFVDGTLPGDVIRAKIVKRENSYGKANLLSITNQSRGHVKPICPLFGKCGGCHIMHLSYQSQLELKRKLVVDALKKRGKIEDVEVLPCIGSPTPISYRNKIQLPVQGNQLGLYARNSHDLIEIEHCYVHCDLGEEVYKKVKEIIKTSVLNLRYVLIKTAENAKEVLVILVSKSQETTDIAEKIMAIPFVKGVVLNINPHEGNTVLGEEFHLLAGQDFITENLCGLKFKISPSAFFQVNVRQAENLYQKALEFAQITKNDTVLDAYCGVGTLSLLIAQKAKSVTGIEWIESATKDAAFNAQQNNINSTTFIAGKSEEIIETLPVFDIAFLNPPRKGCEKSFLEALAKKQPKKILYISCDPGTLARDLAYLKSCGYTIQPLQPFDMFPQTAHVETVVCLTIS